MITAQPEIVKNYQLSPLNTAATVRTAQEIDAETRHRIYDRVLTLLASPQIRVKKTGEILPFIVHPKAKAALIEFGFTVSDVAELESEIINDADENLSDYEVLRDVPLALYHALKREGAEDLIFDHRIVPLPNLVVNALICEELRKEFSRQTLLNCEGFTEVRRTDEETGFVYKSVRLDIDDWRARKGFMMPVYRNGKIRALKIFKDLEDEHPFWLKTRVKEDYAN